MSERPTPETDTQQWVCQLGDSNIAHDSIRDGYQFARRLERERDEARDALRKIAGEVNDFTTTGEGHQSCKQIARAALTSIESK